MPILIVAGLVLEAGCLGITRLALGEGEGRVLPFVGIMLLMGVFWLWAVRRVADDRGKKGLGLILGFAFLFYLTLLPGPPLFDNDLYRYLWDGKVTLSGVNPYRYAPADLALASLRDPDWHLIGYPRLPTPYPPAAQLLFAALRKVSVGSLPAAKALLGLCFLASVWLVLLLLDLTGHDRRLVILWAWNPLMLKECVQSGHVDVAAAALLLAALLLLLRGRDLLAGAALTAGALVKLYPVFAVPFFLWRSRRRGAWLSGAAAAAVAIILPFRGAGGKLAGSLGAYGRYWLFNQGPWGLWESLWDGLIIPGGGGAIWARVTFWGLVTAAAIALGRRWRGLPAGEFTERLGLFLFGLVVLSPAVMPWYLMWGLPLVVFRLRWPVHGFTVLAGTSYLYYLEHRDIPQARWVEYAALAALVWWEWRAKKGTDSHPSPA